MVRASSAASNLSDAIKSPSANALLINIRAFKREELQSPVPASYIVERSFDPSVD